MSSTFNKIYDVVSSIPRGSVATYGQVAALAGIPRGARVVGWAMKATPEQLMLPCHRVVSRSGKLAPEYAFGGYELQKNMLEAEGIGFTEEGTIDMKKHIWTL